MRKVLNRNGFTLVELLVVMGIIGILMALLFPAIGAARKAALKAQAQTEVRAIATAIEAYFNEYEKYPIPVVYQGKKEPAYFTADYSGSSTNVIKALTADDIAMNTRKIVFLEAQDGAVNGQFLDPWGNQYEMKFDADYTGKVEFYSGGSAANSECITKSVIVMSWGPDGVGPQDTNADGYKLLLDWDGHSADEFDEICSHID